MSARLGLAFCVIALSIASAQTAGSPCSPAPEIEQALRAWRDPTFDPLPTIEKQQRRWKMLEPLLQKYPKDTLVHRRYQEYLRAPMFDDRQRVTEEYRRRLDAAPGDPTWLYLYALTLTGYHTKESIQLLEKALVQDPQFQPARLSLARIYSGYPAVKDLPKAAAYWAAYQKACPESVEGFEILPRLDDPAALERGAVHLRNLLAKSSYPPLGHYDTLWTLEFRNRPTSTHAAARQGVEEDLARIRAMERTSDPAWYDALETGYRLLNNEAAALEIEKQFARKYPQSNESYRQAQQAWVRANPFPKLDDPVEVRRAYAAKSFAAASEWARQWPHNPMAWDSKMSAFHDLPDAPKAQLLEAADKLLETLTLQTGVYRSFPPVQYRIGEMYLIHNVRLEQIPKLFEQGTSDLEEYRREELNSDYNPKSKSELGNYALLFQDGYPLLFESYLRRGLKSGARHTIDTMDEALARVKPAADTEEEERNQYRALQATLWELRGRLAEAEGRKLDAVAAYRNAQALTDRRVVVFRAYRVRVPERLQTLWAGLGGSPEGMQALLTVTASPQKDATGWQVLANKIPEFAITDTVGRTWHLAELKGKRTLVNIWATWCGPCVAELATVQKLYDRLKDRESLQLVTFNVDDNPGAIEPFMKQRGYTFPVLPANNLVYKMMPLLAIPRTWVVNPQGVVVRESVGFGFSNLFEDQMMAEAVKLLESIQ